MRRIVGPIGLSLVLVASACSGGGDGDGGESADSTSATGDLPEGTGEVTIPNVPSIAGLSDDASPQECDAYLELLGSGAAGEESIALAELEQAFEVDPPAEVSAAIDLLTNEATTAPDRLAADAALEAHYLPACLGRYEIQADGGEDADDAASQMLTALSTGDSEAASLVAAANVVAALEPWGPRPEVSQDTATDELVTFSLDAASALTCQFDDSRTKFIKCVFS